MVVRCVHVIVRCVSCEECVVAVDICHVFSCN